jgi:hypothetical protein
MKLLPLSSLDAHDIPVTSKLLLTLSELKRLDFPVVEGFVLTPPEMALESIVKEFGHQDITDLWPKIETQIKAIAMPEELYSYLKKQKLVLVHKTICPPDEVWLHVQQFWAQEILAFLKIDPSLVSVHLSGILIAGLEKNTQLVYAYSDDTSEVIIETNNKVSPQVLQHLDQLINT